jgi:putative PIN family toxin of toxin-antitoxin system
MLRVVIDTDVLLSAFISPAGASRQLVLEALDDKFALLLSTPLLVEYESVLLQPPHLAQARAAAGDVNEILDALAGLCIPVVFDYNWRPTGAHADDELVVETAINGHAVPGSASRHNVQVPWYKRSEHEHHENPVSAAGGSAGCCHAAGGAIRDQHEPVCGHGCRRPRRGAGRGGTLLHVAGIANDVGTCEGAVAASGHTGRGAGRRQTRRDRRSGIGRGTGPHHRPGTRRNLTCLA